MQGDTSELVSGDHRPFNAICDRPFAHILISDRSSVLSNVMKKVPPYLSCVPRTLEISLSHKGKRDCRNLYIEHQI